MEYENLPGRDCGDSDCKICNVENCPDRKEEQLPIYESIEQAPFYWSFVRMCTDGYLQGWHEANGGNASYRLTEGERYSVAQLLDDQPGIWIPFGMRTPEMGGEIFLVTATGKFMRNVAFSPQECLGLVEIDERGSAYRTVWGFAGGGRPTSEFVGHFLIHAKRRREAATEERVVYHCHPIDLVALTKACDLDERSFTQVLWHQMTDAMMLCPDGVGVVPFFVPGTMNLAVAVSEAMCTHRAVMAAHHGLFVSGADCDEAFGLAHVLEKSAAIYKSTCIMCGGQPPKNEITDEDLRYLIERGRLPVNFDCL